MTAKIISNQEWCILNYFLTIIYDDPFIRRDWINPATNAVISFRFNPTRYGCFSFYLKSLGNKKDGLVTKSSVNHFVAKCLHDGLFVSMSEVSSHKEHWIRVIDSAEACLQWLASWGDMHRRALNMLTSADVDKQKRGKAKIYSLEAMVASSYVDANYNRQMVVKSLLRKEVDSFDVWSSDCQLQSVLYPRIIDERENLETLRGEADELLKSKDFTAINVQMSSFRDVQKYLPLALEKTQEFRGIIGVIIWYSKNQRAGDDLYRTIYSDELRAAFRQEWPQVTDYEYQGKMPKVWRIIRSLMKEDRWAPAVEPLCDSDEDVIDGIYVLTKASMTAMFDFLFGSVVQDCSYRVGSHRVCRCDRLLSQLLDDLRFDMQHNIAFTSISGISVKQESEIDYADRNNDVIIQLTGGDNGTMIFSQKGGTLRCEHEGRTNVSWYDHQLACWLNGEMVASLCSK